MNRVNRKAIVEAKHHLYHLLLELPSDDMTGDDIRIGRALVKDSEIQAILSKAAYRSHR